MRTDLTEDLPDSPGVYLFYGASDELLCVGKSKSMLAEEVNKAMKIGQKARF